MFGRDALTNLSHLTKPNFRVYGYWRFNTDLELMSSIFQTQIHNLRMARECYWRSTTGYKPDITVGDLVLVRDHTSKCFKPKYKVDVCVVRVEGNKVEVNGNNRKLCWFHISDVKKTDMVTKLVCQLPDVDRFSRKGRLSFDPEHVQDLGWTPDDWKFIFNPDYAQDISDAIQNAPKQRSHPISNAIEKCISKWGPGRRIHSQTI